MFLSAIKDKVAELASKAGEFLKPYLEKIVTEITDFLMEALGNSALGNDGWYLFIGVVGLLIAILLLAGIIGMLKKCPKLFLFIVFILGGVGAIWWFLGGK